MLFVAPAISQEAPGIDHFTIKNGLPQNSVKSISADAPGYIWLATEEGLVRFGGRNLVYFDNQEMRTQSKQIVSIQPYSHSPDLLTG